MLGYRFPESYFLVYAGRMEEAMVLLEPVTETSPSDFFSQQTRFLRHALRGERHRIPELPTDEFLATEKRDPVYSTWAATFYAMLGDSDRIAASLGAGGMCEVYRARDERLGRDVAVNVLPRAVADDPERLARFQRLLDRVRPE